MTAPIPLFAATLEDDWQAVVLLVHAQAVCALLFKLKWAVARLSEVKEVG